MKREYPRGQEEFARVLAFSDGVYAIAMTLLVLSITLPNLMVENSERELLERLRDLSPQVVSFVISFAVIGRYWLAHHQFISRLRALDAGLIVINRAHRNGLLEPALTPDVYRWARAGASSPVGFFVISLPVAFVSTTLAVLTWFGAVVYQALHLNRRKPPDADSLLS